MPGLAAGPAATAELTVEALAGGAAGGGAAVSFTLLLRIPAWAQPAGLDGSGGASVEVNGTPWAACPGRPAAKGYCSITRLVPPAPPSLPAALLGLPQSHRRIEARVQASCTGVTGCCSAAALFVWLQGLVCG